MVLPPGELNGIISQPLPVYWKNVQCCNRFPAMVHDNKHHHKVTQANKNNTSQENNTANHSR